MTMVNMRTLWPQPFIYHKTTVSTTFTVDATGEKSACVFYAPKAGNISSILFRTRVVTTSHDLKVSLQGVDSSGNPDGTILGSTGAYYVTSGTIATDTWYGNTYSFGTSATVVQGQAISAVIEFNSTVGAINFASGNYWIQANNIYGDLYAGAGPTWTHSTAMPTYFLKYDDGTYWNPYQMGWGDTLTVNTGTTPDEVGNIFTMPFKCVCSGIWVMGDLDQDGSFKLYGTNTRTATYDKDRRLTTNADIHLYPFDSGATETLTAGTQYRMSFLATSGSSVSITTQYVPTSNAMAGLNGGGNCYYTYRADAGSWTDENTRRVNMGLIISQIDDGVSTATYFLRNDREAAKFTNGDRTGGKY